MRLTFLIPVFGIAAMLFLWPRLARASVVTTGAKPGVLPATGTPLKPPLSSGGSTLPAFVATTLSAAGLNFIKAQEGFRPNAYPDGGKYSIGYGHQIISGDGLSTASVLSEAQAASLLLADAGKAVDAVRTYVHVPLTQNQFDALVSLAYNIGVSAFANSSLVAKLNNRDYAGAVQEFGRWIYSQGVVNAALVARRSLELQKFSA